MRQISLIITLFCALIFSAPTAYAQQSIDDALDEILKDGNLAASDQTQPEQLQAGRIDNIPVEIVFKVDEMDSLAGSILIVSAYAPAPPNVRRSEPVMLGQTRLLLTDMGSPLKVIIATPSAITQDLEYARIEATITDTSGTVIYSLKAPGKYDGYVTPTLNLTHIGDILAEELTVISTDMVSKTVRGKIKLSGKAPKFKGSNLVIRLVEDGLAGGISNTVLGEMRQILDGKRAPFAFEFEGEIDPSQSEMPLALETWIEDWSGRKTHVTPAPTPYTGPKTRYRIKLDAIGPQVYNPMPSKIAIKRAISRTVPDKKNVVLAKTKPKPKPKSKDKPKRTKVAVIQPIVKNKRVIKVTAKAKPAANNKRVLQAQARVKPALKSKPKPRSQSPYQKITGKAHFNANKGLPRGSVLIAELERRNNGPRPALLASTRVFLDGLSGAVSFKLKANSVDLDPTLPSAKLRIRIEDKNGKLFFSNLSGTKVRRGFNAVTLTTSPHY